MSYRIIPDRIEAATFVVLGAMTKSPLTVTGCKPEHLLSFLHVMRQMGVEVERGKSSLTVIPPKRPKACDVVTLPYPAFPTDRQAQTMALATLAEGTSVITADYPRASCMPQSSNAWEPL